jgi:hypothetical protein
VPAGIDQPVEEVNGDFSTIGLGPFCRTVRPFPGAAGASTAAQTIIKNDVFVCRAALKVEIVCVRSRKAASFWQVFGGLQKQTSGQIRALDTDGLRTVINALFTQQGGKNRRLISRL